jgi:hypothetical protein
VLCAKILKRDNSGYPDEFGGFKVIDLTSGRTVCDLPLVIHWRYTATKLMWIGKDQLIILDDGHLYRVDYVAGKVVESTALDIEKENDLWNGRALLSENGRELFSFDGGGKCPWLDVSRRDIETRKQQKLGRIELGYGCWCNQHGLVPGGKYFYFGDPGLFIHERENLRRVVAKEFKGMDLLNIAFNRDGTRYALVTGGRLFVDDDLKVYDSKPQSIVRVHETITGKTMFAFPSPTRWIRAISFSNNGKSLALVRDDGLIEIWPLPEDANTRF